MAFSRGSAYAVLVASMTRAGRVFATVTFLGGCQAGARLSPVLTGASQGCQREGWGPPCLESTSSQSSRPQNKGQRWDWNLGTKDRGHLWDTGGPPGLRKALRVGFLRTELGTQPPSCKSPAV